MANSKRHHHNFQPSHSSAHLDRHIFLDDVDGEDQDVVLRQQQLDFSCPYCFEDFDITSLCYHLEDEHCFESTPAVSAISLICYSHQDYGVIHIHPWVGLPGQVRTQMVANFFFKLFMGCPWCFILSTCRHHEICRCFFFFKAL
jgi:hypothetical protein